MRDLSRRQSVVQAGWTGCFFFREKNVSPDTNGGGVVPSAGEQALVMQKIFVCTSCLNVEPRRLRFKLHKNMPLLVASYMRPDECLFCLSRQIVSERRQRVLVW